MDYGFYFRSLIYCTSMGKVQICARDNSQGDDDDVKDLQVYFTIFYLLYYVYYNLRLIMTTLIDRF